MSDEARKQIFVGSFHRDVDRDGTIAVPVRFRKLMFPSHIYVLPDIHTRSLMCYPATEMERRLERVRQHSMADPKAREFARVLGSMADVVAPSDRGRIHIRDELMEFAVLKKRVLFLVAIDRIELGSAEAFDKETVSPSAPKVVAEQARAFFGVEVTEAVEAIRNLYRVPNEGRQLHE